ncbi:MAG: glutamate synthase large subunit [Chloroflexota bacterium]
MEAPGSHGLYDPRFEQDSCGVGFIARLDGRQTPEVVRLAIQAVVNLSHRGAMDADAKTGDGAGILARLPRAFFVREARKLGVNCSSPDRLGVAMTFLPADPDQARAARETFERAFAARGLEVTAWRPVPVNLEVLGDKARATCPRIEQALILPASPLAGLEYERRLYLARKEAEAAFKAEGLSVYIPSCSHRTIVYKGLLVAKQLAGFYPDLSDPDFVSDFAIFHQRYSTNTFPTWPLAQPFRLLAHNGEINTLTGNVNWMKAREPELASPVWGEALGSIKPVIVPGGSDSAMLDNTLELLVLSGRSILQAMLMLIPEAWEGRTDLDPEWRAFYDFHAGLMEPWDGPAAIAFADGRYVGAILDRNGLRPLRYQVLKDGLVVAASEVGVIEVDPARVEYRGRLGPGDIIAVDLAAGRLLRKPEVLAEVAEGRPYGRWLAERRFYFVPNGVTGTAATDPAELARLQCAHGWTNEDVKMVAKSLVAQAQDLVWSMGDDTPLAALSTFRRPLSFYFKQRFAQVTNPPIDPLREGLVMSLDVYLGPRPSLLEESPEHARLIHLPSPILTEAELAELLARSPFRTEVLPCLFPAAAPDGLEAAVDGLCARAEAAVDAGAELLVLSDRGVGPDQAPIPMLLAVSAVHHHLIRRGKRMRTDLVLETGSVWDIHQAALLVGYGAAAICPYLLFETARTQVTTERDLAGMTPEQAVKNAKVALEKGLLKIMSKMGISALRSYRGAQVFEVLGLDHGLVEKYFPDTPARLGGVGLRELTEDILYWHRVAFGGQLQRDRLPDIGYIRHRRDGEYHGFNPEVVRAVHRAVESGDYQDYLRYLELVRAGQLRSLRDLMEIVSDRSPIPVEEVEPVEEIRRRFVVSAMSLGALSRAAQETLAVAMNRMGARTNTGEGGEDRTWYRPLPSGDWANNRIKQVASGRFGVTTEYLIMADELEIKIAQGSKPGEGGQLPAIKVSEFIARVRHTIPGIQLISPPPHHDIYSIEDLAQLIYDLKTVNPQARVGVKLVAESGVGTIAAGVAKAYADYIQISGMDGGTGASPLSSIKNAGCPWELGLAETQQVLMLNGLRGRVRLRTDGGLKTGRDVVIAALLGADEYGFGTAALLAIGCDMARQCHLNTCPAGIATQREELIRTRFKGRPEHVINFFTFIAQEIRQILAAMGYRRLDEIIGRVDLLQPRSDLPAGSRAARLDLSAILKDPDPSRTLPRRQAQDRNDPPHPRFDDRVLPELESYIRAGRPVCYEAAVRNSDLAIGARIAGEIVRHHGPEGLPPGTIELRLKGSAGQSFGAFCANGLRLILEGEANDYVGKGMSGGEVIIYPPRRAQFRPDENVIVGNTVLYGATGGRLFVAGRAGERFAVRNSGAVAVVEGTGDHCCEYMTQGLVVVLGPTGRNFGAGMSHGRAYVFDPAQTFPARYNPDMVTIRRLEEPEINELRELIETHLRYTGSPKAAEILATWPESVSQFWAVVPKAAPAVIPEPAAAPAREEKAAD